MIDKFCEYLTQKIKKEMPEIDEERVEIIQYGLQLIVGEIPKLLIILILAFILKIGWIVLFAYFSLLPYKVSSGGFHCKTHIGCFAGTCVMYFGVAVLSKYILLDLNQTYLLSLIGGIFCAIMITLYAPADTENVPILSKKERKKKRVLSYIFLIINLSVALILPNQILSNVLLFGTILHTFTITKLAYKLTNNKYGYEVISL